MNEPVGDSPIVTDPQGTCSNLDASRLSEVEPKGLLGFFRGRSRLGKFEIDCAWNFGSLAVLALSGVALNFLIAARYGAAGLGVFNQIFAVYMIGSQIAAGGFVFSIQRYMPVHLDNRREAAATLAGALLPVAGWSVLVCILLLMSASLIGEVLESPEVGAGIRWVVPGAALFAINKLFLAALNGLRQMRAYAVFQGLRFLLFLGFFFLLSSLGAPAWELGALFSLSEAVLLVAIGSYCWWYLGSRIFVFSGEWAIRHLRFAIQAFPSGLLYDLNFKVDILLLGLFVADSVVGVYTLAAFLAEGLYQLAMVIQTNLNPLLTLAVHRNDQNALRRMVRNTHRLFLPAMALAGMMACLGLWLLVPLLTDGFQFSQSVWLLCILAAGVVLSSGYIPFMMLLNQAGRPLHFTLMLACSVFGNTVLNLMLIPELGSFGAAIAVAMNHLISIVLLKQLSRKVLLIEI